MKHEEKFHVVLLCMLNDIFSPPGSGWIGGGQVGFFEFGRFLVSKGHKVTYFLRQTDKAQKNIEKLGSLCQIIRVPNSRLNEAKPRELGNILDELIDNSSELFAKQINFPVIIHSQYWIGGACAFAICQKYELRHVHSFLSLGRFYRQSGKRESQDASLRDAWELKIYSQAKKLIAQSGFVGKQFIMMYPKKFHKKLIIIPHGVDHELFTPRPEAPNHYLCRSATRFN
jgi:glycosyltransferase involved in cell wall biosynthesis